MNMTETPSLTKRELFAIQILAGTFNNKDFSYDLKDLVESSVEMADLLIKELENK